MGEDALAAALAAWVRPARPESSARVYAALAEGVVLLAVRARVVSEGVADRTGLAAEREAELDLVTVTLPDGRQVLPAFSSPELLLRWRLDARPVRSAARDACQAVLEEGWAGLVLDPGSADFVLGPDAVRALADGFVPVAGAEAISVGSLTGAALLPAQRPQLSEELAALLRRALAREPAVSAGWLLAPVPAVVVGVALRASLDPAGLATIGRRLAARTLLPALSLAALDPATAEQADLRCPRLWP